MTVMTPLRHGALPALTSLQYPGELQLGRLVNGSDIPVVEGLEHLAESMFTQLGGVAGFPAGYTYVGQFLDHDISRIERIDPTKPKTIANLVLARTPTVDLDSVYGAYQGGNCPPELCLETGLLALGKDETGDENDLPRDPGNGKALIPDDRNDENLIVAQMHLAFLKAHNVLQRAMPDSPLHRGFSGARTLLIALYQHLILIDFLERILDPLVYKLVVKPVVGGERPFYQPGFLPIEFMGAAYRFGHSTVLEEYRVSNDSGFVDLSDLLDLVGERRLDGQTKLPREFVVDWSLLFSDRQHASKIDTGLARDLRGIREGHSLASLNLNTGRELGLNTGQNIAEFLDSCLQTKEIDLPIKLLKGDQFLQFSSPHVQDTWVRHNYHNSSPAWHYVLHESRIENQGECLGPVGSLIVALTIIDMIQESSISVLDNEGRLARDIAIFALWGEHTTASEVDFLSFFENTLRLHDELQGD